MTEPNILINKIVTDWLTLTTFNRHVFDIWQDWITDVDAANLTDYGWRQYRGERSELGFVGQSWQNGRPHFIGRVSGANSHRFYLYLKSLVDLPALAKETRCTRIDVQLSYAVDTAIDGPALADNLKDGKWNRPGRAPNISYVVSDTTTVYAGSRSSSQFYRLYDKLAGGDLYRRIEIEFKDASRNPIATAVFNRGLSDPDGLAGAWLMAVNHLPACSLKQEALGQAMISADPMTGVREQAVTVPQQTFRWYQRSVEPALKRLLAYHETRDVMLQSLHRLVDYGEGLE